MPTCLVLPAIWQMWSMWSTRWLSVQDSLVCVSGVQFSMMNLENTTEPMTASRLINFLICASVRWRLPGRKCLQLLCEAMTGPWKTSSASSSVWSQRCEVSRMMLCLSNSCRSLIPSGVRGPSEPVPVA